MSNFEEMKQKLDSMGTRYTEWKTTTISTKSPDSKVTGLSLVVFENEQEGKEYFFNPDGSFLKSTSF